MEKDRDSKYSRYAIPKFQSWIFPSLQDGCESCLGTNRQERAQDFLTSSAVGIRETVGMSPMGRQNDPTLCVGPGQCCQGLQHLPSGTGRNLSHQFPKSKHGEMKKSGHLSSLTTIISKILIMISVHRNT